MALQRCSILICLLFSVALSATDFKVRIYDNYYTIKEHTVPVGDSSTTMDVRLALSHKHFSAERVRELIFCGPNGQKLERDKPVKISDHPITQGEPILIGNGVNWITYRAYYCRSESYAQLLKRTFSDADNVLVDGVEDLNTTIPQKSEHMTVFPKDHVSFLQPSWSKDQPDIEGFAKRNVKSIQQAILKKIQEEGVKAKRLEELGEGRSLFFKHPQDIAVCGELPVTGKQFALSGDYVIVMDREGKRFVTVCPDETYGQLATRLYGSGNGYRAHGKEPSQTIEEAYKLNKSKDINDCERILFVAHKDNKPLDYVYDFVVSGDESPNRRITGVAACSLRVKNRTVPLTASRLASIIVEQNSSFGTGNEAITLPICSSGVPLEADTFICVSNIPLTIDKDIGTRVKVKAKGKDSKVIFLCPKSTIGHAAKQIQKVHSTEGTIQFEKSGQHGYASLVDASAPFADFNVSSNESSPLLKCKVDLLWPWSVRQESRLTPEPLIKVVQAPRNLLGWKVEPGALNPPSVEREVSEPWREKVVDSATPASPPKVPVTPATSEPIKETKKQGSNDRLIHEQEPPTKSQKRSPSHRARRGLVVIGLLMLGCILVFSLLF